MYCILYTDFAYIEHVFCVAGSGLLSLESEEKECVSQLHEILRKAMIGANHKVNKYIFLFIF